MATGATITVNNSRNEGQIDGGTSSEESQILKQILEELKIQNRQEHVARRKEESGFGVTAMSRAGGLVTLIVSALAGLGIIASQAPKTERGLLGPDVPIAAGGTPVNAYTKIENEKGEQYIAEINRKTGDIVDIISMEEAKRRGIIDNLGNIVSMLVDQEAEAKSILSKYEEASGIYQLTNEALSAILKGLQDQQKVDEDIFREKQRVVDNLKKINERYETELSLGRSMGSSIGIPSGRRTPTSRELDEKRSIVPGTPLPYGSSGGFSSESATKVLQDALDAQKARRDALGPSVFDTYDIRRLF